MLDARLDTTSHQLHALLVSAKLEHLAQQLLDEELSVGVLRYMATQATFADDLADLGIGAADAATLRCVLEPTPLTADAATLRCVLEPTPPTPSAPARVAETAASSTASASGDVIGTALSVVGAALIAISTTDVVSGRGTTFDDEPVPTGWSATQINHVGAAVAPPPRPKGVALLSYLRREGKGHFADPGKMASGGRHELDAGTLNPNRSWQGRS